MLFGLPWFAVVAIVAIVGGLMYDYKEKELKSEEKRMGNLREFREMQQLVNHLKSRVDRLESDLSNEMNQNNQKVDNSLGDIEIQDEVDDQNSDNSRNPGRVKSQ